MFGQEKQCNGIISIPLKFWIMSFERDHSKATSLLVVESLRNWDTTWLQLGYCLDVDLVMLLTELAGSGPLTKMGAMVDAAADRDPIDVSQMVPSAADGRINVS
ncbi:hypothetical protein ACLOJK_016405 [Asimina triloba]